MKHPFRRALDPKVEELRTLPLFAGAGQGELAVIAAAVDVVTLPAGSRICERSRSSREAYLILAGSVEVVASDQVVAVLGRGEIAGELGVIDGKPRSADVIALTQVTALAIPSRSMHSLLDTSPSFRRAVLRQLAHRVRQLDDALTADTAHPVLMARRGPRALGRPRTSRRRPQR